MYYVMRRSMRGSKCICERFANEKNEIFFTPRSAFFFLIKNEIYGFDNPRYMYVRSKKGQSFGIGGNYMKIPVSYVKVP